MDILGEINLTGLASVILFYLLILAVGMWAAQKKSDIEGVSEEVGSMGLDFHVLSIIENNQSKNTETNPWPK